MTVLDRITDPACVCDAGDLAPGLMPVSAALTAGPGRARPVCGIEELPPCAARGRILAAADGLVLVPGDVAHVPEGDLVDFRPLRAC